MSETCKCHVGKQVYRLPYPPPVCYYISIMSPSFKVEEHSSLDRVPMQVETWIQSFEFIDGPTRDHIVYYRQLS